MYDNLFPAHSKRALFLKRSLDLILSLMLLIMMSPAFFIMILAIVLDSKGGPFYNQDRIGESGKLFKLYKFRTMYQDRSGVILGKEVRPDDDRVTRVGKFLRRFKLDETPQLLNVVLGHVSLVGPRPDIPVQVAMYNEFKRQRLAVRPGLTGIAQVSGNIWLSWSDRIVLDVWYIKNWSFWLDVRIIWETFRVLMIGEQPDADPFRLRGILHKRTADWELQEEWN